MTRQSTINNNNNNNVSNTTNKHSYRYNNKSRCDDEFAIFENLNVEEHRQRPDFRFLTDEVEKRETETATSVTISQAEASFIGLTSKKVSVDDENKVEDLDLLSILNEALAHPLFETNLPEEALREASINAISDMDGSSELSSVLNESLAHPLFETNLPEEALVLSEASINDISDMDWPSELPSVHNEALALPVYEGNLSEETLGLTEALNSDFRDLDWSLGSLSVLNQALAHPVFEVNLPEENAGSSDLANDDDVVMSAVAEVQQSEVDINRPQEPVEDL